MIAALYVDPDGVYAGRPDIDAWCELRDARCYAGPYPVVAHPPCQRWGRFWHGSTRKPHQYKLGDDKGCFKSALMALHRWGGVIEHPCDSHAWTNFKMDPPRRHAGWMWTRPPVVDDVLLDGEWHTCYVEQGHYGHMSRKMTWLLAQGIERDRLPELNWSKGKQRLHPTALARYGYAKARRIGMTAMVGGKNKTKIRNATPPAFRDVLIGIAQLAKST
ncbi:MAG: hypothetical protein EBR82_68365 [Caulobacteraceae bacterium]|nr:hypothetical protein [Caulobacteraceae bacterium]